MTETKAPGRRRKAAINHRPPINDRNMVIKLLRHSAAKSRASGVTSRKRAAQRLAQNQPTQALALLKQAERAEDRAARVLRVAEWIERV